ncbi:UNVERIFIED_CONTAM: BRCT domain-containing protein [Sesamum radiatum]|uniref:BRCT domain-containing protein n=1 Tax=Sesamum radiatum TaxID=300843 RepID=A0AAW2UU64_SESRA
MVVQNAGVKSEPAWFILSGHRLQRKEFQQVIRRLKGRVCRDSHHWSYQATHFIVPDPIRRTEKFFAAAASGSWILKTDYLTASNEAGRLLSEEPYEWHKKCLTEDGAINLEAPRKWRLLRERTGHGAFYGMRIVIYGECIAPPLDTLKRVVKAGDGTILATSPPYTRLFKSRIDFAIISPGMPRVDMWVQEFLRHEVPCVVADYLVEYVCKPGYSLERHVQYNTHAWAKKSLENLINRVEEVIEDPRTPDHSIDDVACNVCGSGDRGDEMIICGAEDGSHGCGAGVHIDCLNPPLEDVPSEDWFCPECSHKGESKTKNRSSKKRGSTSKM